MTATVLSSPKMRRRLGWTGALLAVAVAIAGAAVLLPSRSGTIASAPPPHPAAEKQARAYAEPPTVPAPRTEINALLDRFIPAVIARKDLAAGWALVAPEIRGSRADWRRGVTPFQEFPARDRTFRGWQVNYSYPGDVGFDVFLAPKNPDKQVAMAFRGEAKQIDGAWKIVVFYPQATFQPVKKKAFVWADTDLQPQAVGSAAGSGRLGAAWLLVPVALFGVALVGGLGFALARAARRRGRRREIERELAALR
ncbi:MAG TPA: hypothetical protein VK278_02185 [Gaiellaceae bacterium]|nr:hypothetical protein [Gaiellaceae bacterium]